MKKHDQNMKERFEKKKTGFFLKNENPESDLLGYILEGDPIFLREFIKMWVDEDLDYFKIKIIREHSVKEGRLDFRFELDGNTKLILEIKKIGDNNIHSESEKNLLKYLGMGNKVGLLMSKDIIAEGIINHDNFTKIRSWKEVASVLKERLESDSVKLMPKSEILYWCNEIIKYIQIKEGDKIMKRNEIISFSDALAFSAKNELIEKFNNVLEDSLLNIKKQKYNHFKNPNKKEKYQNKHERYGLVLSREYSGTTVSLFYGYRFNLRNNGVLSLYSFIETDPRINPDVKNVIIKNYRELENNYEQDANTTISVVESPKDWGVILFSKPFSLFLVYNSYEEQINNIKVWFDNAHRIFTDIFSNMGVKL